MYERLVKLPLTSTETDRRGINKKQQQGVSYSSCCLRFVLLCFVGWLAVVLVVFTPASFEFVHFPL